MRPQTEELSEFEKQRLANIAERDALLKKLTLEAQASGLWSKPAATAPKAKPAKQSNNASSRSKRKPAEPRVKKEDDGTPIVRRMSSRLRGITADSEVAKRKADEAFEEAQKVEREKRLRKSDFFTLDNMLVSGQKLTGDALIGIDVVTKGVAKPYERTFGDEDVEKTTDKDLKALREEMSSLELWDQWTPGRRFHAIYIGGGKEKKRKKELIRSVCRHQSHSRTYLYNDIPPVRSKASYICRG